MAFLDVRVFNPNTERYTKIKLSKAYEINKKEKKKAYKKRILQVKHGSFTPLVMLATVGEWMQETLITPSRNNLQEKKNQLQRMNHMDLKKNCIFVNKMNWSILTWMLLSSSEWQPGDVIKQRHVHKSILIEHVDQQYNIWCMTSIKK